jgi:hypothetical protein
VRVLYYSLAALCLLSACRKDEIEVRRAPKEDQPGASAMAEAPPASGLHWTAPAGWTEKKGSGMRASTLTPPPAAGKAEVTVIALPGDVGGELANVNRWRGQLALPPITEAALAPLRATVHSRAGDVLLYDFTGGGAKRARLLAGMIRVSGTTWFFKLMGDEAAVEAAKPAFRKLLEGLKGDAA